MFPAEVNRVLLEVGLDDAVQIEVRKGRNEVILPLTEISKTFFDSPDHRMVVMYLLLFFLRSKQPYL